MEIKPGQSLLHYRIVDSIGSGGMGEVYRAEDSRLKRQVALKVLPPDMAADPERRQRFEREAQAVAALNHPNIVTIYSVEQAEAVHFITMELIEGEPLSRIIGPEGLGLLYEMATGKRPFRGGLPAYEAYLRGLEYMERSELQPEHLIALQMMTQAVKLDPDFAEAHAELGTLHSGMYHHHWDRSDERLQLADQAIETAFRLSPGLPEAHIARGYYHYWGLLDYGSALEEFAVAADARPNNTRVLAGIGFVKRRQGRMDEALVMFRRSAELNPRDLVSLEAVALTSILARDYDEAERIYARLHQLRPGNAAAFEYLARIALLSDGDIDRAREVIGQSDALNLHNPQLTRAAVQTAIVAGDYVDALRRIDAAPGEVLIDSQHVYWPKGLMLGRVHALAGDTGRARENYEAARDLLERRVRELPQDERIASALGLVYAGLGRKQDAIREGLRGVELLPYEREALRGAQRTRELAQIYALVGEPDLAIDRLEYLLARPGFDSRTYLKLDPIWTPLRDHPRFRRLVDQ